MLLFLLLFYPRNLPLKVGQYRVSGVGLIIVVINPTDLPLKFG